MTYKKYEVCVYEDGYKEWYLNGEFHREDGPAVEDVDGYKEWWVNGKRHREDGPAVEWADDTKAWWVNGTPLTQEEFKKKVDRYFDEPNN